MKLKSLLFFVCMALISAVTAQDRYVSEIFDTLQKVEGSLYAVNITVQTGAPTPDTLLYDVYMPPMEDTLAERPVVLVMHTGTFFPKGAAFPTGDRLDYANMEVASRLARMGYVAVSYDYRVGWNPLAPTEIERRASILQAAYRSIQDTYTLLRHLQLVYDTQANPFRMNLDKIAMFGIGTGGFVGLNMVALDDWTTEIFIPKFRNPVTDAPFIDTTLFGDIFNTKAGAINVPQYVDIAQPELDFAFGLDGALGDSSWMDIGEPTVPMVLGGTVRHSTTPFGIDFITNEINCNLPVFEAVSGVKVVDIAGSACLTLKANALGYNDPLKPFVFDDPITEQIATVEYAQEHLWPIHVPNDEEQPQEGAWEYWDSTFWKQVPSVIDPDVSVHDVAIATNPDMSLEKSNRYIDTAMYIFAPRACVTMELGDCGGITTGLEDLQEADYSFIAAPNPTRGQLNVSLDGDQPMTRIQVFDMFGRLVRSVNNISEFNYNLELGDLAPGMYGLRAEVGKKGYLTSKIMVQN